MKICKTGVIGNVQYSLFCFGKLPIDILLPIRKAKYLHILTKKNDKINDVFRDLIQLEIDSNITNWKKLGQNLKFPCKFEGWNVFSKLVNAL